MDNDSYLKILFVPMEKDAELVEMNPSSRHAIELRKYILKNNIDIDNIENKLGYMLSIELLARGIMTFQYEGEFVSCFIPKEITEKQYLCYKKNRKDLKKKIIYITNMDKDMGLKGSQYFDLDNSEGYLVLDNIMEEKEFVKYEEIIKNEGRKI